MARKAVTRLGGGMGSVLRPHADWHGQADRIGRDPNDMGSEYRTHATRPQGTSSRIGEQGDRSLTRGHQATPQPDWPIKAKVSAQARGETKIDTASPRHRFAPSLT